MKLWYLDGKFILALSFYPLALLFLFFFSSEITKTILIFWFTFHIRRALFSFHMTKDKKTTTKREERSAKIFPQKSFKALRKKLKTIKYPKKIYLQMGLVFGVSMSPWSAQLGHDSGPPHSSLSPHKNKNKKTKGKGKKNHKKPQRWVLKFIIQWALHYASLCHNNLRESLWI